ncbi:PREDICTED: putative disease resistance RPP13-like protein 1 [Theobroma cacao]|uniref:Disease resistance RPP13-like protein 1 n=1 Tax=Theobroma cacao TaxID=3641 RepID=A0AB32X1T5_THECC|nr:PREDICTED: putative disease resistance RPP13-like protein 1 [Theobroma cacao]
MQNLSNLKGQLYISELHDVDEAQYAWEAKLSSKLDLENLELKWSKDFNINLRRKEVEKEVLNLDQPHKDIKELAINYYARIEFPDWVEDDSFKNLQVLRHEDSHNCTLLPAVGKLPLLKHLYAKGMRSVISVGNEFHGVNGPNVFPSLETLHFENMFEWKEWKLCEVDEQEKLVIHRCQELVVSISNLPMLCELEIDGCKEVVFESYDDIWTLYIGNCENLRCLLDNKENINFRSTSILQSLDIGYCEALKSLSSSEALPNLHHLQCLTIRNCQRVQYSFGERGFPTNLTSPSVDDPNISKAVMEWGSHRPKSLTKLNISGSNCTDVVSFPQEEIGMKLPPSLTNLIIRDFKNLRKLSSNGFQNLTSLQSLWIDNCPKLRSIPRKEMLPSLLQLSITVCPMLKKSFVNGTNLCPPKEKTIDGKTVPNPNNLFWHRQDQLLKIGIMTSEHIIPMISSAKTFKDVWDHLSTALASASTSRTMGLTDQLANITKGTMTVSEYIGKIRSIVDELALARSVVPNTNLILHVLNGVGSEYKEIAATVQARNTPISLKELHDKLIEYEFFLA